MNANVVGVQRDGLSQVREEASIAGAHLPRRGRSLKQEVLEELPFVSPRRRVEPEVKVEIVHAGVQRDVEDWCQAANSVREATDGVFKGLGGPTDFSVEPTRGRRPEAVRHVARTEGHVHL